MVRTSSSARTVLATLAVSGALVAGLSGCSFSWRVGNMSGGTDAATTQAATSAPATTAATSAPASTAAADTATAEADGWVPQYSDTYGMGAEFPSEPMDNEDSTVQLQLTTADGTKTFGGDAVPMSRLSATKGGAEYRLTLARISEVDTENVNTLTEDEKIQILGAYLSESAKMDGTELGDNYSLWTIGDQPAIDGSWTYTAQDGSTSEVRAIIATTARGDIAALTYVGQDPTGADAQRFIDSLTVA